MRPKPEPVQEPPPPAVEQPPTEAKVEATPAPVVEEAKSRQPEKAKAGEAPRRPEQIAKRGPRALEVEAEAEEESRAKKKGAKPPKSPVKTGDERRERIKLTINNAFDEAQRERSLASLKRRREREKLRQAGVVQPRDKVMREVIIPEVITIQELANRMTERAVDVIKLLMGQGAMHKINDVIDADTAELIVREFGHTPKRVSEADVEEGFIGETDAEENLQPRAPVVTIMGHVDHGKTSLLDAIRHDRRRGGRSRRHHAAHRRLSGDNARAARRSRSSTRRATRPSRPCAQRGAKVTDIVVLVVAADDGVMPQTVEAINHAKAAGVPLIVAINKIDKPDADPNRVRTDAAAARDRGREHVGRDARGRGVGTEADRPRQAARGDRTCRPSCCELKANPEPLRRRRGHRGQARARPRAGRHRAGAARHAAGRRYRRCRHAHGAACAR